MSGSAIAAGDGTYSYADLDAASRRVAAMLLTEAARLKPGPTPVDDLQQARVAFLVEPSFAYAAVQRGIWRAGGVAVPLALSHPAAELDYVIRDSGAQAVIGSMAHRDILEPLATAAGARFLDVENALAAAPADTLPHIGAPR